MGFGSLAFEAKPEHPLSISPLKKGGGTLFFSLLAGGGSLFSTAKGRCDISPPLNKGRLGGVGSWALEVWPEHPLSIS